MGSAALLCVASCQRDRGVTQSVNDNLMGIRVEGSKQTRSNAGVASEVLFKVPVVLDNGDSLEVVAVLSDMEGFEPETRGAAVTTENIGPVYGSFPTSVYKDGTTYSDPVTGASMANVTVQYQSGGEWELVGGLYHWPDNDEDIVFCSYLPRTGLGSIDWHGGESLTFSYSLPSPSTGVDNVYTDAADQPDIVFGMDKENRTHRVKASDGKRYADIYFNHALTAVRFTRGTIDNCTIETIGLKGFKGAGTATGTPDFENHKISFAWTVSGQKYNYTQTFNRTLTDADAKQDRTQHAVTGANIDPTADQSYTFMMIPQLLETGASIEIKVKERIHPLTVDLSGATDGSGNPIDSKLKDWRSYAGKVITISINSVQEGDIVDVDITDQVSGIVKTDAVVTNTPVGNPVYVRVAIIANWVKDDGTIIYPYPIDNIASDSQFEGVNSDWVYSGGFYYYKHRMPAGDSARLFDKFTAPVAGSSSYPSTVPDIDHLQMTLLVQGVDAARMSEMADYGWDITHFVD